VGGGLLIPPANYSYLNKLHDQQQQQQQQQRQRAYLGNGGSDNNNGNGNTNNNGFFSSHGGHRMGGGGDGVDVDVDSGIPGSSLRRAVTATSSSCDRNGNNDGNVDGRQQDSTSCDDNGGGGGGGRQPIRFTAAMMATGNNFVAGNNHNNNAALEQQLHRELLHQQQQQQQRQQQQQQQQQHQQQKRMSDDRWGNNIDDDYYAPLNNNGNINNNGGVRNGNSTAIGLMVVEPPSNSNSPAPQRGVGGGGAIGVTSEGLLYPLLQQQQWQQQQRQQQLQQQLHGRPEGDAAADYASAVAMGGRASAPPVSQSRGHPSSSISPSTAAVVAGMGMGIGGVSGYGAAVPGMLRAFASSSLQMRVAELHQELGNNAAGGGGGASSSLRGGGAMMPTSAPAGGGAASSIPTPAPTPPPLPTPILLVPSRPPSADPLLNRQITRSASTPLSTISSIASPVPPGAVLTIVSGNQLIHLPHNLHHPAISGMMPPSPSPAAVPSSSGGLVSTTAAAAVDPERRRREQAAAQELAPFLRDPSAEVGNGGVGGGGGGGGDSGPSSVGSRGLAILYASSLHVPDVRSTCEAFGALESFRSDFGESRGVFFAMYYDLRSARLGAGELPMVLNNKAPSGSGNAGGGGGGAGGGNDPPSSEGGVQVKYCVPFNSSCTMDEGTLMLSNLPGTVDEQDLNQVLSSFGEVRAIHYQANASDEDEEGNELTSYLVEFYDIQDARQALLELEHTHPWGGGVKIKVGTRSPTKRKLGKELVLLMSTWRASQPANSDGNTVSSTPAQSTMPQMNAAQVQQQETSSSLTARTSRVHDNHQAHQQQLMHAHQHMEAHQNNPMEASPQQQSQPYYQYPNTQNPASHIQQYQLVVGPDGQYSYVLMNHSTTHPHYPHPQIVGHHYGNVGQHVVIDPHNMQHQHQQQIMYASALEQHYIHNQHHQMSQVAPQQYQIQYSGASMPPQQPGVDYHMQSMAQVDASINQLSPPTQFIRMSANDVNSDSLSSASLSLGGGHIKSSLMGKSSATGIGGGMSGDNTGEDEGNNVNLLLSIDHVRSGRDRRSSLMVRNIPNKYTQQMLLSEFANTGHGSDKMDFFYLPIDFKNKCNRGYAFVNFVDYKDIIPFFSQYTKCGWKRFNSDKICDITYARIQGKAAMLKRFENSSLMEKDDEYRPMVFVSHGERKGQIENIGM
jgi:RNA recognition motif-containing protein